MNSIAAYVEPYIIAIATLSLNRFVEWVCSSNVKARASTIKINETELTSFLDRELNFEDIKKAQYSKQVNEITKLRIISNIKLINRTLETYSEERNYSRKFKSSLIKYNENDSIETLAIKVNNKYFNTILCNKKIRELYQKIFFDNKEFFAEYSLDQNNIEASYNGILCWVALRTIFAEYYQCKVAQDTILNWKSNKDVNNIIVEEIDPIIEGAIQDLEIKKDKHFSSFRMILDPSLDLTTKMKNENINSQNNTCEQQYVFLNTIIKYRTRYIAGYLFHLQALVDCLNEVKNNPKTINDLHIINRVLNNCYNHYKDKESYMQIYKNTAFADHYFEIKSYLLDLKNTFHQILKKSQTQYNLNKSNKNQKETSFLLRQCAVAEKTNPINISTTTSHPTVSIIMEESDEDDLRNFTPEAIVFVEMVRQLYEKDRKAKIERKKALEAAKFERKVNQTISNTESIQENEPILRLSRDHQKTINTLFTVPTPHFKITGHAIKHLILALQGRLEGEGGFRFKIFWKNSKKRAGTYEVHHTDPNRGLVTAGWVENVVDAIRVGVRYGGIARETLANTNYFEKD